jgi:hypothetical protein
MITSNRASQTVFVAENWDECAEHMYELMAQGYVVSNLDYYNDLYVVVMDKGASWQDQEILFAADFPQLEINDYWDKGLDISYVAADDLTWMLFFSAATGIRGQEWVFKPHFSDIKRAISTLWGQGKTVTDIRQSFGGIVIVMSGGINWNQWWTLSKGFPQKEIEREIKENNRFITLISEIDERYFIVMSAGTDIDKQIIFRTRNYASLQSKLDDYWKREMFVTTASFVKGELIVVFSK